MQIMLAFVLILATVAPASADVFDLSWTSSTFVDIDGHGTLVGGTLTGDDATATWDRLSGTLGFIVDGHPFGGTLMASGLGEWNQALAVPTHPDARALLGGDASTLVTLHETAGGFTLSGGHASMFDFVSFSGTATAVGSVAAAEPAELALVAGVGLAIAALLRRRRPAPGDRAAA